MKYVFLLVQMFTFGAFADDLATETKLGEDYTKEMALEPNAYVHTDGIVLRPIYIAPSTMKPTAKDSLEVMYEGFDREGKVFDSSFLRDQTATFPLPGVIPCWQKALPEMTVGSVYKITCPTDQAYGKKGAPGFIKPGAAISFRVVLLQIK